MIVTSESRYGDARDNLIKQPSGWSIKFLVKDTSDHGSIKVNSHPLHGRVGVFFIFLN
jgi:hypothetical protein